MSLDLSIQGLRSAYAAGSLQPAGVLRQLRQQAAQYHQHNIWIHLLSEAEQEPWLARLAEHDPASLPLWGIPFAIKDNIDLAGIPTTAACPAFAYTPATSAVVVQQLLDAGAIPVGKTNLDQFATGLTASTRPLSAAAPVPAPPWRWHWAWRVSAWAPTRRAPAVCPPASTTWSG
jgi:allophanate hydrolase